MTDRELLELAAKAAGIEVIRSRLDDPLNRDFLVERSPRNSLQRSGPWNPLTDDGDALRLAVKLGIDLMLSGELIGAFDHHEKQHGELRKQDPYAATRRAIVRAAAEIGKEMK